MKGLYLSNIDPQQSIGYLPKILGQAIGFAQLGINIDLICFDSQGQITLTQGFNGDLITRPLQRPPQNLVVRRISLLWSALSHIKSSKPDFLYLRYPRADPLYLVFLGGIRLLFPRLIILSEFPTFPYDQEYAKAIRTKDKIVFTLDKITRSHLHRFIDCAVAINYERPIFGIPTIAIDNGIHVDPARPDIPPPKDDEVLNFIGVANVSPWHGYDRILYGLSQYYQGRPSPSKRVIFRIVGAQPPYLGELQRITKQLQLEDCVLFHGPTQGQNLDRLLATSHLAIGVLGGHRKNMTIMSPLKNREYCARGIPFVFSHEDPDFPDDFPYSLKIEMGEKPVNIQKLIDFFENLQRDQASIQYLKNYAEQQLSWKRKLSPIKAYIDQKSVNPS